MSSNTFCSIILAFDSRQLYLKYFILGYYTRVRTRTRPQNTRAADVETLDYVNLLTLC